MAKQQSKQDGSGSKVRLKSLYDGWNKAIGASCSPLLLYKGLAFTHKMSLERLLEKPNGGG